MPPRPILPRIPLNLPRIHLSLPRTFTTAFPLLNDARNPPPEPPADPPPQLTISGITLLNPVSRRQALLNSSNTLQSVMRDAMRPTSPLSNTEDISPSELTNAQYKFSLGERLSPHDLSFEEFRRRTKRQRPTRDAFDLLGFDPRGEYKNFNMLAEYVTDMGRIKHRNNTGLRPVNQRRIAKAIRRAVGIGLLPSTHKHPEILKQIEDRRRMTQQFRR